MRAMLWALGAVLTGMVIFEVSMHPTASQRIELGLIFSAMAVAMLAAARWLPGVARRSRSIRTTLAVLAVTAFSIVVAGVVAIGNRMFVSSHDVTLLLVVLAFGVVSAVGFAFTVSRPLSEDIDGLAEGASRVAGGDLRHVTDIDRSDEVGRLATALNTMITRLERAETERKADAGARREFFAAVGHDLRTPLSSMRAAIEAVRDGVAADPDEYLTVIEHDIAALSGLVEDIYLLARLDSGDTSFTIEDVDVTEVADECREILRPLARERKVTVEISAEQRHLARAAQEPTGRIIRNLVDNAIRHSPEGGTVVIDLARTNDAVIVAVSDSGPGFDPDFEAVAFERFSRAEPSRARETGGSGLGLAIARGLSVAMNGDIWISPGDGGRVGFSLPAAEARSVASLS